jgi:outer membrane protein assembly factor BamB
MSEAVVANPTLRTPLRLWPGVVAVTVLWLLWLVVPAVAAPDAGLIAAMIGFGGGTLATIVWWLFFSRAPWLERVGALLFMVVAVIATRPLMDRSIQNGFMDMMFYIFVVPNLCLALVVGAAAGRGRTAGVRGVVMAGAILIACSAWMLARTDGVIDGGPELAWRWTPTAEERLLARTAADPVAAGPVEVATKPASVVATEAGAGEGAATRPGEATAATSEPAAATAAPVAPEWPGFRGPSRDGIVRGVHIDTDWAAAPPVAIWRRAIGPGWSSFAIQGDRLYTQEQRGDDEIVACYRVSTGEPVWMHRDATRFWESNGGAGPRGTPTLSAGRVHAFGATGMLNVLDARDGRVVWARNVASDIGAGVPMWGFASSPLVTDDLVIVAASGKLVAYDAATGAPRWRGPVRRGSYSSPHLTAIDGVPQVLLLSADGVVSVAPGTGALLWEHEWAGGTPIVQPAVLTDGDVLVNSITATGGQGIRRLAVTRGSSAPGGDSPGGSAGGWSAEERWTSRGLKPYFNDLVVHRGHAYGFDGSILSCIDLADGERAWKGGRYGSGQLVLLADQDLLLVMSEEGELALVSATPDQFREIARTPALDGKTWNHPVLVGDVLLVRNGEEMAAFRLTLARR